MNDTEAYQAWKSSRGAAADQAMTVLLTQLAGVIGSAVNSYRAAPLPSRIMELEARHAAVGAIRDWDTTKGMGLASYVGTQVRNHLYRFTATNQNVARIPEHQIQKIGPYNAAVAELTNRYDREPTTHEIADHLSIPVKHVVTLRKMLRKDLVLSGEDSDAVVDLDHDPDHERAMLGYYSLSPQEKTVFDYLLGAHGQQRMTPKNIAAKLGVSPARISLVKSNIADKLNPYLRSA